MRLVAINSCRLCDAPAAAHRHRDRRVYLLLLYSERLSRSAFRPGGVSDQFLNWAYSIDAPDEESLSCIWC